MLKNKEEKQNELLSQKRKNDVSRQGSYRKIKKLHSSEPYKNMLIQQKIEEKEEEKEEEKRVKQNERMKKQYQQSK